ncbi:TetR/AcrR family transcriptional regulator [Microbacterium sp. NPDC087868]|uniref:TetR/AcrR family transcriptional regulator n=1 Tax=Microbacterium sp. NPDC087868 TaxID=3364195 RepID=UPI00384D0456
MAESRIGRPPDQRTRVAALRATRELLLARGYEGVAMSDIAAAAGVPRQTLYRRWPTKQALVADCVLDDVLPVELVVVAATGDLRADIDLWLQSSIASIEADADAALFRALLVASASDESARQRMVEHFLAPLRNAIERSFAAAGREGHELVADALLGAMVAAIVSRDAEALRRVRDLGDLLTRG